MRGCSEGERYEFGGEDGGSMADWMDEGVGGGMIGWMNEARAVV